MEQEGLFMNAVICPETSLVEVRVDGLTFSETNLLFSAFKIQNLWSITQ